MEINRQRVLVCLAVLTIVFSGCIDVTTQTEVKADGTVERQKVVLNTTTEVYQAFEQRARQNNYSSVKKFMKANLTENNPRLEVEGKTTYSEKIDEENNDVTITITMTNVTHTNRSGVEIKKENGRISYRDQGLTAGLYHQSSGKKSQKENEDVDVEVNADLTEQFENVSTLVLYSMKFKYEIKMPGKITNTTADKVNGDTAIWNRRGTQLENTTVYVESKNPSSANSGNPFTANGRGGKGSNQGNGSSLPGFTVGMTVTVVLSLFVALRYGNSG